MIGDPDLIEWRQKYAEKALTFNGILCVLRGYSTPDEDKNNREHRTASMLSLGSSIHLNVNFKLSIQELIRDLCG